MQFPDSSPFYHSPEFLLEAENDKIQLDNHRKAEHALRHTVGLPREEINRWYEALNDIYSTTSPRTSANREQIADLRDEIYSWLEG
jgi:hypothetical protein